MIGSYSIAPGETPETVRRKRRVAEALMAQMGGTPTTYGGGINALLTGIGAGIANRKADAADAYGARMAKGAMDNLGAAWGSEFPAAPKAPGEAEAPDQASARSAQTSDGMPQHRRALLDTISGPESGGDYDIVYGGGRFDDFSDHPRRAVPITSGPNKGKTSSAAGKYQFLGSTWDQYRDKLGLPDFSPGSQDTAAWELASDTYRDATGGDLDDVLQSNNPQAIANVGKVLNGVWTSLPGGIEQGTNTDRFLSAFQRNMGGGGQNRLAGSVGNDPIGGGNTSRVTEALVKSGQGVPQPTAAPGVQRVSQALATQNVPPTNAGLQNPKLQSTVQALMRQGSMGGAPQRFQQSNASPGIQQIAQLIMGQQQPQQRPVQMAQAQGAPEMAGSQLVTRDAMGGPSMQMLMDAANNPWLDDNQRGYVNTLMEQQLRRQQSDYERQREMATPEYQIDLDTKRLALDKGRYDLDQARRKRNLVETKNGIYDADTGEWITNPNAPAESAETGLNPQLMRDKDGNYFYAQPTKDGRITRSQVEDGAVPVDPYGKAFEASKGKKEGEAAGEAVVSLPEKLATADYSIKLIDGMLDHPGRETATGLSGRIDPRNWVAGTDATDFNVRRKQITGRTFLEAFDSLRGGGQITQIEGEKATDAMARLDTAQSDEAFFSALTELRELLDLGKQRAIAKAGGGEPSGTGNIPPGAIEMLRNDPTLAEPFDAKFGVGAAARIMGGQ